MSTDRADSSADAAARERLSALVDGELEHASIASACSHWREDAQARSTWHAYQVIGDVLRSDELAGGAARNAAFLTALRARLETEPVVLAPEPLPVLPKPDAAGLVAHGGARVSARPGRRWAWIAPSAVAAGFVVVAGVVMVMRGPELASGPVVVATNSAGPAQVSSPTAIPLAPVPAMPVSNAVPTPQPTLRADSTIIRDARLDRYLAAHKQFAGSSVLGWPSASVQRATAAAPAR